MRLVRITAGLGIMIGLYLFGEWLMGTLRIPFPGSLAGLLLCTLLLALGVLKLEWVEDAAALLLRHMAAFFLPLTAGLISSWDLIRGNAGGILFVVVAATMVVLAVTGRAGGLLRRRPEGGGAVGK